MTSFHYVETQLWCEQVPLATLAAQVGTPFYVYSETELWTRAQAYQTAVSSPHLLTCYAIKANANPSLIRRLAQTGFGADVTSGGELYLAQQAGVPPQKIIYSGVGKTPAEIAQALTTGIRALHAESEMELGTIAQVAADLGCVAAVGVRVNPDIQVDTHPYISTGEHAHKFGVTPPEAMRLMQQAALHPWLRPVGLAAHIGSQITDLAPFVQSAHFLVQMADELAGQGIRLDYLDVGGGLGINYERQDAPSVRDWVTAVCPPILQAGYGVVMEPGRSVVGPAGVLVTAVTYTKRQGDKQFIITDAGMSDLLRPTLYNAYHPIWPINQPPVGGPVSAVDVVGPICETGDWLARARPLPPLQPGDLLALLQAGAYGYAMSSNYNGRLRPAELLVNGQQVTLIRQRQKLDSLTADWVERPCQP